MSEAADMFVEIQDLARMLPRGESDSYFYRAAEVYDQFGQISDVEVITNLRAIRAELRNFLPNYEVLTVDDFNDQEINAVTIGVNNIPLGDGWSSTIPPGTRIIRTKSHGEIMEIQIEDGRFMWVRKENFPVYGIRIQPREKKMKVENH